MFRLGQIAYWAFIFVAMLVSLQLGGDLNAAAAIFMVIIAVPIVGILVWFILFKGVKLWNFGGPDDE